MFVSHLLKNLGHSLNGHQILEFSAAINNQTNLSLSKLKVREATLWLMIGSMPKTPSHDRTFANEIVQLHHLGVENDIKHPSYVNTKLLQKTYQQTERRRKKRKQKNKFGSDKNYYFENRSYNHITNDNNNGNHIITNNSSVSRRRNVRSIDPTGNNKLNNANKRRHEHDREKNLTLWIFRIKTSIDRKNITDFINDKVCI